MPKPKDDKDKQIEELKKKLKESQEAFAIKSEMGPSGTNIMKAAK